MTCRTSLRAAAVALVCSSSFMAGGVGAAAAGEAEIAVLQSFTGSWRGAGTIDGPDGPREISCTMNVSKAKAGKVVFRAACPFSSVSGGMVYNDAAGRYELAFTSSTNFRASATGRGAEDGVNFDVRASDVDKEGNTLTVNADFIVRPKTFVIDVKAKLNDDPFTGVLTFRR